MGLLLALSPLALQSSVMSEKGTSFMPHYQIRRVGLLRTEMRMAYVRFSDFVIHQCQPGFAKKYEDSWPIMAYLEIYLLSRIRTATYLKRHFGRCKEGFVRCPDPIWQRYAEVPPDAGKKNWCPVQTELPGRSQGSLRAKEADEAVKAMRTQGAQWREWAYQESVSAKKPRFSSRQKAPQGERRDPDLGLCK
ncbi:hypothetical protein EV401DRAFT_1965541 [Pisolithus croceorrhizus]|nr:hypothetical protein EV401DRAFT_1965541 [Pisolithus croceorrhizus]